MSMMLSNPLVPVHFSLIDSLREDAFAATLKFGRLMWCIFDNERRPRQRAYTGYHVDTPSSDTSPPQTLGSVDLHCDFNTSSTFEAMCSAICSAMVTNQSTKKLCMYISMPADRINNAECVRKWKWLTYAFFSNRARQSSALESLVLAFHDSLAVEYAEAFASILTSDHPDEDLCGCPSPT
ncbi:hypothetical protein PHYSODRAFT_306245 [Phytophthora sojae]|uniref:Uncharacterized protein n=1 Tax=Phytophthora sojae (strain P6497) TaxID=1094619 RepID=G5A8L3_PHYSP|nr:hypothetical protein PHYSODRAFT_306245 [Phytophthora sojae]EGZ08239.1 hypothetical protein PHYSODRAFT_306245 [Phytophthora sojae]|eukprot:XP_009536411.1 hypothetical protein PHYSODRAFT_306245 [Phytophthora sojae]